jgi:hypothetical protein
MMIVDAKHWDAAHDAIKKAVETARTHKGYELEPSQFDVSSSNLDIAVAAALMYVMRGYVRSSTMSVAGTDRKTYG